MEHTKTPTPWYVNCNNHQIMAEVPGWDARHPVAECKIPDTQIIITYPLNYEANAAFIVKAVNAHDELVQAIIDTMEHLKEKFYDDGGSDIEWQELVSDEETLIYRLNNLIEKSK
jgi:hypothetical protein